MSRKTSHGEGAEARGVITRRRFLRWGAVAGGSSLMAVYPVAIERYMVFENHYHISVPRLPDAFEGFTIVHLTDLHHGPLTPLSVIRGVVERANAIARDITVCTGDYVALRNTEREIEAVWPVMNALEAPQGVYAVLGNHDHWAHTERSISELEASGFNLRHRVRALERKGACIWLAGTGDLWEDARPLDELLQDIPEAECRIVLAHNPDSADTDYTRRVDLMLSGHTHGGQVCIPWLGSPIVPVRNKRYDQGLCPTEKGHDVFISRGIGWTILPIRFNCTPEIAVLHLTRA